MIKLIPDKKAQDATKLDFEVLSTILTILVKQICTNLQRAKPIRISITTDECSCYITNNSLIKISTSVLLSRVDTLGSILHEFRHWMQEKIFKTPIYIPTKDFLENKEKRKQYDRAPSEIDSRKMEKMTNTISTLYNKIIFMKQKADKLGLNKVEK